MSPRDGVSLSVGEPVDEVQRARVVGRQHADSFGADGNQDPAERHETERGEDEHAHGRAAGFAPKTRRRVRPTRASGRALECRLEVPAIWVGASIGNPGWEVRITEIRWRARRCRDGKCVPAGYFRFEKGATASTPRATGI